MCFQPKCFKVAQKRVCAVKIKTQKQEITKLTLTFRRSESVVTHFPDGGKDDGCGRVEDALSVEVLVEIPGSNAAATNGTILILLSSPEGHALGFTIGGDFSVLAANTNKELLCQVVAPRAFIGDKLGTCSIRGELLPLLERVFRDQHRDETCIVELL